VRIYDFGIHRQNSPGSGSRRAQQRSSSNQVQHSPTVITKLIQRAPFYERVRREYELGRLRRRIRAAGPLNVVIGGGERDYDDWIKTDREVLDITQPRDWRALFEPNSIDRLLCEHVLEHLSDEECRTALAECHRYVKRGGIFRVAVPDGYRRDAEYVAEVAPPNAGHKQLFTIDTFVPLLADAGFSVTPLEYFDAREEFHADAWDEREGFVARSVRFDSQERFRRGALFYTSIVVDARKV
jgi:predicted SAM-dependent methyltransferase